jgi:hypothetical protein
VSRARSGVLAVVGVMVLVGTLALGMWTNSAPTSCDDPPRLNILALEFAGTTERAADELDIPCGPEQLHNQLHRDGLYIVVYSLAIAGFAVVGTRVLDGRWQRLARFSIVGGPLAGLLDVIENAFLDQVADGDLDAVRWATVVTVPKWILALLGVAVGVATIVALARQALTGVSAAPSG